MNWTLSLVFLLGLLCVSQAVILSLEESELGAEDYRYFYLTMPVIDNDFYQKPFFTLVNSELSRPYGALGSLVCSSSTDGIAVYLDIDNDNLKEWVCGSINLLPFAHQGGGVPIPPICSPLAPSGIPAIWNSTLNAWECGTYNQILTLATRDDISQPCGTADFLMYYGYLDEIRCVDPHNIDPALTLQARDVSGLEEFETRVDIKNDKKWFVVMSDIDATGATSKPWNVWRWTPHLNYDSTSGSSLVPTPPVVLPFSSTLLAVTIASFKVSSYTYIILPPTTTDTFTAVVTKLSTSLAETTITNTLTFNSISATSGQVTYSMSGNAAANANAGESFVVGITGRQWVAFTISSDRHLVAVTLWIQTSQSFTEYWA